MLKHNASLKSTCYRSTTGDLGWDWGLGAKTAKALFVENFNLLMRSAGLSNTALAAHLGVTTSIVTRWRSGQTLPEVSRLTAISAALGVPVARLFLDEADAAPLSPGDRQTLEEIQRIARGTKGRVDALAREIEKILAASALSPQSVKRPPTE